MKYKLVVSDFDGTLCRSDNTVSERSRRVIDEFFRRGGIFTLSSGRNIRSLRKNLLSAGLIDKDIVLSGLQGSVIEENLTGRILGEIKLPKEKALWFSRECTRRGIYQHAYSKDRVFSNKRCDFSDFYTRMTGVELDFVGDVTEFVEKSEGDAFVKMFAVAEDGKNFDFCKEYELSAPEGVKLFTSGPLFFECINASAGKGNGLKRISEIYGVDINETIALGDEMNDLSMIEAAGLGVAMANAREGLKEKADLIAPSNDEDGVARIIEEYCFD